VVLPNGKQIVSIGQPTAGSVWKLFLVPLDGSATRLVGDIPYDPFSFGGPPLAPSPDGRLLAYTSAGQYTTKIFEVDFGPALQAILRQ